MLSEAAVPFEAERERLVELFLEGFGRCVAGRRSVAVTLSGGIDSRCLLAAGLARGLPLAAYNASVPGSRSGEYARRMAEMTGTSFHSHPVGAEFAESYGERLRAVVALTEGMTFASEVKSHWLREQTGGADVVLHGAFGELSKLGSMHLYQVDGSLLAAQGSGLAGALWARFSDWFDAHLAVLAPELRAEVAPHARRHLEERVAELAGTLDVAGVLQVLYLEEFLGKVTRASAVVWNDHVPTCFAFADPAYVDALLRVRAEDRVQQRVQMEILRHTRPELFRFPDANTGLRVDAPPLLARALKLADKIRVVLAGSRRAADHSDRLTWQTRMRPSAEEILFDHATADLFDRPVLERVVGLVRGEGEARGRGPIAGVRRRIARYRASMILEKAMLLCLWHRSLGEAAGRRPAPGARTA